MVYILDFEDLNTHSFSLIGGKNASLGEMIKAGIRVPPGFAVTTDAYLSTITETRITSGIFKMLSDLNPEDMDSINEAGIEIQKLIMTAPISSEVLESIKTSYARLSGRCFANDIPVAVRSSATAEDLPTASFAGQHDTYLWVNSPDLVVKRVQQCWASLFTPRAIGYRAKNHVPHEKVLMSVGIQKMVNSRAAGVMFTLDPTNGDRSKVVIEGNWGLGETVVSGSVNPDRFVIDKVIKQVDKRTVSVKHVECVYDPNKREVLHTYLPEEMQCQSCLNDDEIKALVDIAKTIETYYGRPMDIEWAIDRDSIFPENIFMVQARPETVWSVRKTGPVLEGKTGLQLIFSFVERGMKGIKIPMPWSR